MGFTDCIGNKERHISMFLYGLNEVTHKDAYPLLQIDETLETLAESQLFLTLDLASGYWQAKLGSEDRQKTAFCTAEGLYEFNIMPFGLCNAPATFQRLMSLVLSGFQWSSCLVYLDDMIVMGKTFEEHLKNLDLVFSCIREAGLKIKLEKCSLLKEKSLLPRPHRVQGWHCS